MENLEFMQDNTIQHTISGRNFTLKSRSLVRDSKTPISDVDLLT